MDRSNTQGAQLRNLYEETRNANASIAPEGTRLQAQRVQLPTRASTMRNQDKDSVRIYNRRIIGSMLLWTKFRLQTVRWTLGAEIATSKSVDCRLKLLTCELRWNGINPPKVETQKIFEIWGKSILPWLGEILGNWPRLNDSFSACKKQKLKHRVVNLNGKTRKKLWTVGITLQKNCVQQVSDEEILLCWLPHTPLETHLSLLNEISQSRAKFLLQHDVFHLRWLDKTVQRKEQNEFRRAG